MTNLRIRKKLFKNQVRYHSIPEQFLTKEFLEIPYTHKKWAFVPVGLWHSAKPNKQ